MRKIESRSNPAIKKAFKALNSNIGLIATEGFKLFYEAEKSLGRPVMVFACRPEALPDNKYGDVSFLIKPCMMRELSGLASAPPILAFFKAKAPKPLAETVKNSEALVVLDRLQDPGNVGTILRTSEAMGIDAVIALSGSCAVNGHKAIRASMGAFFRLQVFCGVSLGELLILLKENNFARIALDMAGSPLEEHSFGQKSAFFFGQEGQGLCDEILKECDATLAISMQRQVESLNVASSAAICLYQWQTSRKLKKNLTKTNI